MKMVPWPRSKFKLYCSLIFVLSMIHLNTILQFHSTTTTKRFEIEKSKLMIRVQEPVLNITFINVTKQWDASSSPSDILILSYMRSGSSFLGQLLGLRKDAFYMYEPLFSMAKFGYFTSNKQLCDIFTGKCGKTKTLQSALKALEQVYDCSFYKKPASSVFKGNINGKLSGPQWKTYAQCIHTKISNETCLKKMAFQVCSKSQHKVTKVLRLAVDLSQQLLESKPNLKVVYLVRDPRAIINSHFRTSWSSLRKNNKESVEQGAKSLCHRIKKDILVAKQLKTKYPERFTIVLYEDFNKPIQKLRELNTFLNLKFSADVMKSIKNPEENVSSEKLAALKLEGSDSRSYKDKLEPNAETEYEFPVKQVNDKELDKDKHEANYPETRKENLHVNDHDIGNEILDVNDPETRKEILGVNDCETEKESLDANDQETQKEILDVNDQETEKEILEVNDQETQKESLDANDQETEKEILDVNDQETEKEILDVNDQETEKEILDVNDQETEKEILDVNDQETEKENLDANDQETEKEILDVNDQETGKEILDVNDPEKEIQDIYDSETGNEIPEVNDLETGKEMLDVYDSETRGEIQEINNEETGDQSFQDVDTAETYVRDIDEYYFYFNNDNENKDAQISEYYEENYREDYLEYEEFIEQKNDNIKNEISYYGFTYKNEQNIFGRKLLDSKDKIKDNIHVVTKRRGYNPFIYRQYLSWEYVKIIDKHCGEVYKLLGYKIFKTEKILRDLSIPSMDISN